jgi:hypothetical protein
MRARSLLVLSLLLSAASCAPTLVSGSMTNPAKANQQVEAMQEYDIGPYRQNHRYSVSITKWTPTAVAAEIKMVDDAQCSDANNYTFTLVDDRGGRHALELTGHPTQTSERGQADVALTATTVDGKFAAEIGAESREMTVQLRGVKGVDCPALDFRWDLK